MSDPIQHLLSCRGVVKRYGALAAVNGVDFQVRPGERVGVGGPNGAGKTTFFDLISGLTALSEGEILFRGRNIVGLAPHRLCHLGMARTFQLNSAFDGMSVFDNVLAARVYGRRSAGGWLITHRQDREATRALLADIGLEAIAHDKAAGIPTLARKKLMVATALINEPDMVLLDEPVGGLTPSEVDAFIDWMLALKASGMTLIFVEHVMRFLTSVADRAVMMHQGEFIYDGLPTGLAENETVASVYLGSSGLEAAS